MRYSRISDNEEYLIRIGLKKRNNLKLNQNQKKNNENKTQDKSENIK